MVNDVKNKCRRAFFTSVVYLNITICSSFAKPSASTNFEVSCPIKIKSRSNNGIASFIFYVDETAIYRLISKNGIIIQRSFLAQKGADSALRITEYDLNVDGSLDAIQIGKNDNDFSPFLVTITNGQLDISPLPEKWTNRSEYPFDAFMKYVKAQKGIK
jgi:hypothetical protein